MWLGTAIAPQQIGLMFSVIIAPMIFFGCAYYPWRGLDAVPVMKYIVLINPMVYVVGRDARRAHAGGAAHAACRSSASRWSWSPASSGRSAFAASTSGRSDDSHADPRGLHATIRSRRFAGAVSSERDAHCRASVLPEPTAFALATVARDGRPSVRIVLLKGVDDRGFVFYTNYESRKGRELLATKRAALCFHWQTLEVQVRVEGDGGAR